MILIHDLIFGNISHIERKIVQYYCLESKSGRLTRIFILKAPRTPKAQGEGKRQ